MDKKATEIIIKIDPLTGCLRAVQVHSTDKESQKHAMRVVEICVKDIKLLSEAMQRNIKLHSTFSAYSPSMN